MTGGVYVKGKKKISFTPTHYTYENIKRDDKKLLFNQIWRSPDGANYVNLRSIDNSIRKFLCQRYFFIPVGRKEIEYIKEVYYGIRKVSEEDRKGSSESNTCRQDIEPCGYGAEGTFWS
jgi:hypothetical protein